MSTIVRRRQSLRWQLPVLIASLITLVLAMFLWVAYQGVRRILIETAAAHAQEVASQIGAMLVQSTQQRRAEMLRVAADPRVRDFVAHRAGDVEAVRARLATLALANGPQSIELWSGTGDNLLWLPVPAEAADTLPHGDAPTAGPPTPFRESPRGLYSEAVVAVEPSGFLVVRRPLNANGSDAITRLIGSGAILEVGNRTGDVWTDLARRVPPPAVDRSRTGVAQVRIANGQRRLGVLADVRGTGFAVWLDFPEAIVLAPARLFLMRAAVAGLAVVAIAALLTSILSTRITTPLRRLTEAAEAIAGGEYAQRVLTTRRDEIGRLGASFNAMADDIAAMHHTLERRVEERTASLTEARAELDRFFSLSVDMLCIKDLQGRFLRVNPAWERTLGWTADQILALPLAEQLHPEDVESTRQHIDRLASGSATVNFENRYRCRDGSFRWLSWNAAALPERGLIYAAVRDVTEARRIGQELRDRVSQLDTVNRELEAFSYSVSHDLRAPLRHVTGFASLLEQHAIGLDEQGRRYIRTIVDAASRMGRLIDDLLSFSRISRATLAMRPVELEGLFREARREAEQDSTGRRIQWTVNPLPAVDGDPAMLRLVLTNLLSNAVKYTATRDVAEIEVGVAGAAEDEVVLYVRDNGVGFDPQYAHKLFGVFQRLHTAEEFEGTGIGLANVKRIVDRHGGRVWAEGAVDAGATFYFSLPFRGATL